MATNAPGHSPDVPASSRKRPFSAINEFSATSWPSIGTQPADCEVHVAQVAADARKLLKLRHRKAVPFEVLTPLLLSCVELSNKYSHQVSLQTHMLHGNGQPPRPTNGFSAIPDINQDAQSTASKDSFEQWAEDLAAIHEFAASANDPSTRASTTDVQSIPSSWWEIIVRVAPRVLSSTPNLSMDKIEHRLREVIAPFTDAGPHVMPTTRINVRVRQLRNGNISIRTPSTIELESLIRQLDKWVRSFGHNTSVWIPTYTVKVTTINRAVFATATDNAVPVDDELGTLGRIALGPNLDPIPRHVLAAVRWSPSATDSQRTLMLEFKHPETANAAVSRGVFWNGKIHKAHAFHSLMHFTHCDRCLRYDHEEYACDNDERCVSCAGPHRREVCGQSQHEPGRRLQPEYKRKKHCANCGGDHQARFESCPQRLAENTRSRLARRDMKIVLYESDKPRLLTLASPQFYG